MAETPAGPRIRPPGGNWSLVTIALGILAAVVVLVLVFHVGRDEPFDPDCGGFVPEGHEGTVDAYRSGAIALHLLFAVTIGAGLAWSSAQRSFMKSGRLRIGPLVGAVLAVLAVFIATSLVNRDFFLLLGLPALGAVALPTVPLAVFASLVIGGIVLALPAPEPELRARRTVEWAGWLTLLIWLPASIMDIYIKGEGPFLC